MQKLTNIAKRLYETPEVEAVSVELERFVAQSLEIYAIEESGLPTMNYYSDETEAPGEYTDIW